MIYIILAIPVSIIVIRLIAIEYWNRKKLKRTERIRKRLIPVIDKILHNNNLKLCDLKDFDYWQREKYKIRWKQIN